MGGSHRADVAVCRPAGRTSLLALTVALVAAAVCLFARPAAAKPFDLGGRDWEGCADFVQLARTELGARAVPTSRVELGELTPEDALVLLHPDQPLDVASLGAFGLHYRSDFPYLADPWDGYDNPSTQVRAMAG